MQLEKLGLGKPAFSRRHKESKPRPFKIIFMPSRREGMDASRAFFPPSPN